MVLVVEVAAQHWHGGCVKNVLMNCIVLEFGWLGFLTRACVDVL